MRLGLFGGTFDPVHYGHLLLAESCREACRLDSVWFVPAAHPPHKQDRPLTPAAQRIEMLQLAIGGNEAFEVSPLEVERGGVSYTVETLAALKAQEPERELCFLLGSDMLADLPHWREPRRICELALLVVVRRAVPPEAGGAVSPEAGGVEPDFDRLTPFTTPERLAEIRRALVPMPRIEISSRDIRRRVAAGMSIRYQTPRAVEKYIETHRLYQERDEPCA